MTWVRLPVCSLTLAAHSCCARLYMCMHTIKTPNLAKTSYKRSCLLSRQQRLNPSCAHLLLCLLCSLGLQQKRKQCFVRSRGSLDLEGQLEAAYSGEVDSCMGGSSSGKHRTLVTAFGQPPGGHTCGSRKPSVTGVASCFHRVL